MLLLLLYLPMLQLMGEFANRLIHYWGRHMRLTFQIKAFVSFQRRSDLIAHIVLMGRGGCPVPRTGNATSLNMCFNVILDVCEHLTLLFVIVI